MTAVVGILNKQAVAIAADSAVTVTGTNGRKILNRANKVFTLSKYHPVGVMIYNSAEFMGTPWETIIKMYRKQLRDQSFPTLQAYQENLIHFLRVRNFFTNQQGEDFSLYNFAQTIINVVYNDLHNENPGLQDISNEESRQQLLNLFEIELDSQISKLSTAANYCADFADYPFEEYEQLINRLLPYLIQSYFTDVGYTISGELTDKIKSLVYEILKTKENITTYTGLICIGFGEEEIYPSLIPVHISFAVGNRLRYFIDESRVANISATDTGAIRPFAQTDVIDTMLSGVAPFLENTYLKNFSSLFNKYNQEILRLIGDKDPVLTAQIQSVNVERLLQEYSGMNQAVKQDNYIGPLMNAVSSLAKEDLAEMAESLIYLTYLKRRITFAEESVGGPVDVAIISKGDGFVWIKRKHYFSRELNQHFFDNYFNP